VQTEFEALAAPAVCQLLAPATQRALADAPLAAV